MLILPSGTLYGPYPAAVVEVKDGDTILLDIEIWPSQSVHISVREIGIDTPETRTRNLKEKQAGKIATKLAEDFLKDKSITVDNVHYGKYAGRVMGNIYANGGSLGNYMLSTGFAREYFGGKREPWIFATKLGDY